MTGPTQSQEEPRATWQLLRDEYIAARAAEYKVTIEREYARVSAAWPDTSHHKKLDGEAAVIELHRHQFAEGVPDWFVQRETRRYDRTIVLALQRGLDVPDEVVAQAPEFRSTADAHARYEKGYATSYGNATGQLDRSQQATGGYKMKAQDGRPLTADQIEEITAGMADIEAVVGIDYPSLTLTDSVAAPGSALALSGDHFAANSAVTLIVNSHSLTPTVATDGSGHFAACLQTDSGGAGRYGVFSVPVANSQTVTLDPSVPTRSCTSGTALVVGPDLAFTHALFLPLTLR